MCQSLFANIRMNELTPPAREVLGALHYTTYIDQVESPPNVPLGHLLGRDIGAAAGARRRRGGRGRRRRRVLRRRHLSLPVVLVLG